MADTGQEFQVVGMEVFVKIKRYLESPCRSPCEGVATESFLAGICPDKFGGGPEGK